MKWKNKLKTVLAETDPVGFSGTSLNSQLRKAAETPNSLVSAVNHSDELRHFKEKTEKLNKSEPQSNLVSAVIRSGHSRHYSKNNNELAEIKAEKLHDVLNRLIENGVAFDVSSDDFLFIDTAQNLKLSDMEFLKLNHSIVLCTLQQSLLVKHLFNHSPEQFEDFAFEIQERESIFSEECLNSPLTKADKTPFEIYFEVVKEVTGRWFAVLLEKKEG